MTCLKCGGTVLLEQDEDTAMAQRQGLGRAAHCVNCSRRYYEWMAKIPVKFLIEPYHRNLRL